MREVTAVIPNWNGGKRLLDVLSDLLAQTVELAEVIVIDNGSEDGSPDAAARAGARVVRLARNYGFAVAVNRGVSEAQTSLVAILNNDIRLRPDWLAELLPAVRLHPFAAGKLLKESDPGRIDGCFDAICRGGCAWRCGQDRLDGPLWAETRLIHFAPFTAVLMRRQFYLEVGGLNEALGTYLEDVEFGLRCASKGHTGRYQPRAVASHAGSATLGHWSPVSVRQIARNQVLLIAIHYPSSLILRFGWAIAVSQMLWGLVALKHGAGLAWLLGKADGIRLFASHRGVEGEGLAPVLSSSEDEIRQLQQASGWDWYWRIYFALT